MNATTVTNHWLPILFTDYRSLPPSTASAKFAFAHRVASVLAFPEKFFVGHNCFSRMVRASMFHVGLIVGNSDHETSGLCCHTENGSNTRHGHVPRQAPQLQSQLPSRSDW
jgi:hypothetical protein